jgi:RPA family protein
MNARETAWRMFSKEFNDATLDINSGEERAPSYVVTPLGAKVNRLFIVGVVTDIDEIGTSENPMIRAKVADSAGSYYLSAGQFQPEAMASLKELKPPEFVAVVGKAKVYAPDDTVRLLSVRPEEVKKCDAELRDYWIYETAVSMMRRIEMMAEALKMAPPSSQELEKLGYSKYLAEGGAAAANHYKNVDLESYEELVSNALREIISSKMGEVKEIDFEETAASPKAEDVEVSTKGDALISEDDEKKVLQIVKSLDKDGKGAKWEEIVAGAKKKKIEKERLEEICTDLLDKGDIYEPELGRMKTI